MLRSLMLFLNIEERDGHAKFTGEYFINSLRR